MASVSLCMIVKNEEEVLKRCINSVKSFVDEIIIVDTGSCDKTKEIAFSCGAKVYDFNWCDDFSKARNFAFSLATKKYIMWLDADDVVPKKSLKKLLEFKKNLTADTYMLKYDIAWQKGKCTFSYYRERILKNCDKAKWVGVVHECITPFGKIENVEINIEHRKIKFVNSNRNLKIYEKLALSRELEPREQYYYARELFDHKKYFKCQKILKKYVKAGKGWLENIIDAHVLLADCYKFLNRSDESLNWLIHTFNYCEPRANVCYKIGEYFLNKKSYSLAIYWYTMATRGEDCLNKGGFVQSLYHDYYPYMRLCYVNFLLGNNLEAEKFNNLAGRTLKTPEYEHNKKYFDGLKV